MSYTTSLPIESTTCIPRVKKIYCTDETNRFEKITFEIDRLKRTSTTFLVSLSNYTISIPDENMIINYVIDVSKRN